MVLVLGSIKKNLMEAVKEESNKEEYGNTCSETECMPEDKVHDSLTIEQSLLDSRPLHITKNVVTRRSVRKSGFCNIRKKHAHIKGWRLYLQDGFTSLVDCRWRITLFVFFLTFLLSWFIFAVLWYIVAYEHGDIIGTELYDPKIEPCVTLTNDFISCFLFSLETQYSTGYGSRSPTTECPEGIFVLIIQSIFGMLLQSVMTGIVFAKLARPKARSLNIMFSQKAVICLRDGYLSLMFRVGDVRKSLIIGSSLRAWLLQHRITPEGEILPHYQYKLNLNIDSGGTDIFLIWPLTVLHRIDSSSPLYDLSAADLLNSNFEIVVVLDGTVETTGQQTEARTSYIPNEILWGHRFRTLLKYYKKRRYGYAVDYSRFDQTVEVETPLCSAHELLQYNIAQSQRSLKSPPYSVKNDQLSLSLVPFKLKTPSSRNHKKTSPNSPLQENLSFSQFPINLNTCSPAATLKSLNYSLQQECSAHSQSPSNINKCSSTKSLKSSNISSQEDQLTFSQHPIKLNTPHLKSSIPYSQISFKVK